jgi:molecular chaperone DnaJ
MSTQDWIEKDFYAELGVAKDADQATVKKSYRKLAKKYHPDSTKGDSKAEEKFKTVSEAYDVISDPKKRAEYDEARALFAQGGRRFTGPGAGGGSGNFGSSGFGDIFGGSGGLGDVLGGMFGRGTTTRGPRRGADIDSEVTLGFADALAGVTLPLRLSTEAACAVCHGTGAKAGTTPRVCAVCQGAGELTRNAGGFAFPEPCRECRGRGMVVDEPCAQCHGSGRGQSIRTVSARLPAGVRDGQRIRLKGKGAPGERGGPAGDLYVTVRVTPHPVFGREGDNLTVTLPVSFDEVVLGADVKVPVMTGGTVTVKVPAGSASGRVLRVRGRGATRRDGTHGDLLVTLDVVVPAHLSDQAREAVEAFRGANDHLDPRAELLARASSAPQVAKAAKAAGAQGGKP